MQIIHVVEAFGGGIIEFIKNLTDNDKNKYVVIYSEREIEINEIRKQFNSKVTFIKWDNIQREINPVNDYKAYKSLLKTVKTLNMEGESIMHLHSSKAGLIGRLVSLRLKIKSIYSPNGAPFARKDIGFAKKFFFQLLEIISNLMAGQVVGVSHSESNSYKYLGIPALSINNGIEPILFRRKPPNLNQSLQVITVGRISQQKKPDLFNKIAESLLKTNPDINFIWVGDGELRHKLTSKNITITGWENKEFIFSSLSRSNIYLSTAQWEGLPFAVLEAMNFELPLILSNCTGNIDLVTNANGFLYENALEASKAILFYKDNQEKLIAHGKFSKKLLQSQFNKEKMVKKYLRLYLEMIEDSP